MKKTLVERIHELEDRYRVIADNLIDAIWVVDAKTLRYEFITPSAEEFSGYSAEEFMNITLKDRLAPESFEKVVGLIVQEKKRFIKGEKKIGSFEVELINKDGTRRWAEIKAKFVEEKNKPLKIIGITRDITRQKQDEKTQVDLINRLNNSVAEVERLHEEVKMLRGLLPICSACKRIRDENNKWWPLDVYVTMNTEAEITHTICPDCSDILYCEVHKTNDESEK